MRSVIQSLLARHPIFAAGGVGLRWILWLVVGHPFGLAAAIFLAVATDLPLWAQLGFLAAVETALAFWGLAASTTGARSVYLWPQLCRFRRRFPSEFAQAYDTRRAIPVVGRNYYSIPGGLRPVLFAPQLSLLPGAFSYQTVGWTLRPRPQHHVDELAAAVERIAIADDRVARVQLRQVRGQDLALIVHFERPGSGMTGRLTSRLHEIGDLAEGGGDGGGNILDDPPPPPTAPPRPDDPSIPTPSWLLGDIEPGGTAIYPADIPGLQRFRRTDIPSRVPALPADPTPVPDYSNLGQPGHLGDYRDPSPTGSRHLAAVIAGPWAADEARAAPSSHRVAPTGRAPMRWSFTVIVPANLALGAVVWMTDAGPVAIVALCTGAAISVILIVAEEVAR